MSLVEKVNDDLKEAMKNKDKDKLLALRAIKSALLLAQTEKGANGEVSEDAEVKILQKQLKQRKDAAEVYKAQSREDLYEAEIREASYIEAYLPKMLSEAELETLVREALAEAGATSAKDMGRVMKAVQAKVAGRAEGKAVSEAVKRLLA